MKWQKEKREEEPSRHYDTGRETDNHRRQLDKSTTESGYGELLYLDPSDTNLRRLPNMSPMTEGRQTMGTTYMSRSPGTIIQRGSVLTTVRNDLNVRNDTGKMLDKKPIPTLAVSIPFRKEEVTENERSPKVINLAGGEKEYDFNTRTLNLRRSPRDTTQKINYATHNMNPENNIFLDAPMNMGGNFGREYDDRRATMMISSSQGKLKEMIFPQTMTNMENKMSPNRNSVMPSMQMEVPVNNEQRLQQLKRVAELMQKEQDHYVPTEDIQPDDGLYSKYKKDLDLIENMLRNSKGLNDKNVDVTVNLNEGIPMRRKYTKGYDPTKREGRLIPKDQQSISAHNIDSVFGDRHRVLQKMNKLSSIMMAKSRSLDSMANRSFDSQGEKFDRSTLRDDSATKKKWAFSKSPQQKFISLSLAMMSSKGPNCEDRIILRKMRFHKGGVVDLGQETGRGKNKYQVRKIERKEKVPTNNNNLRSTFAPKFRERACKIIQAWWRDVLSRYKSLLGSIVKIQSVWRGNWLRRYLYDIIYLTYLHQNFCDKIKGVMVRNTRRDVFDSVFVHSERENAHRRLLAILLIQRHARRFLENLTNKRTRMALLLDKLMERKKKDAFDNIKASDGKRRKMRNAKAMYDKMVPPLRKRIFKDLQAKAVDRPVTKLKSKIFKTMLKNNITKFNLLPLREYFMRWFKKSLRAINNDTKKENAMRTFVRNLMKRRLGELKDKLRSLPPKGLKERIIRKCISKGDRYKDIVLKNYFRKWKDLLVPLRLKDMKDKIAGNFLLKTSKRLSKENLRNKFNKWRDVGIRGKDLEPFVNGFDKLKLHCRKRVHAQTMPFEGSAGVYSKMMQLLKNPKYRNLSLRKAMNKWRNAVAKSKLEELGARIACRSKGKLYDRNVGRLLSKRFQDWKRKVNMEKYLELSRNSANDKKRYFAISKLMNGTEKLAKRQALKTATPPVLKHLHDLIRQRATKNLLFMNPKFNRILLRNYFNKFKDNAHKLQMKELRSKMFGTLTSSITTKLGKNYLRRYLLKWNRKLPKNLDIKFFNGADMLQKAVWRRAIPKPIEAFREKVDRENAKDGMMRALGLKKKFIDRHWREYLYKWRKNADKLNNKEMMENFFSKFLNMMLNKNRDRILARRFSHWKKVPKINMADIFTRFKNMIGFTEKVVNKSLLKPKAELLKNARKFVSPQSYKKAQRILANMLVNGDSLKLDNYFNKWKCRAKDTEIQELKRKLLKASINGNVIKSKKRDLHSAFNKWHANCQVNRALRSANNNLGLYKGVNMLQQLKNRRINDFVTRLHRLMNLDSRGRLILNIQKRLKRPQMNLAHSFAKWRRHHDAAKQDTLSKNYISRLIRNTSKTIANRNDRERFLSAFNKWRSLSKRPSDYYLNIANGATKLDLFRKRKDCYGPFGNLLNSKNYRARFLNILPNCNKLRARMNNESTRRCFNKWRDYLGNCRKKDYATMLLTNTKKNIFTKRLNNILSKHFYHWAKIKPRSLHFPNVVKGVNQIADTLQRPHKPQIIQGLKNKADALEKRDAMFRFFGISKTFRNNRLRNAFMKWWKTHLLIDDDLPNRAMRTMKRYIVENHIFKPREKYFRKWLARTIQKPKDLNDYNKGSDLLKRYISRKNYPKLKEMLQTPCNDYVKRQLLLKLVPNSKAIAKRVLSNGFNRWKRNVDRCKLKDARLLLLNKLYDKNKTALRSRMLKSYMNRWREKEPEPKPVDYPNLVKGVNKIQSTLDKKFFVGLLPHMNKYSKDKFLRSLINKTSKYHLRALKPFFDRWRNAARKDLKSELALRLISKTKHLKNNANIKDLLGKKFNQWRDNTSNLKNKTLRSIPPACAAITKKNQKQILPDLLNNLRKNSLRSRQIAQLTDNMKIPGRLILFNLKKAFDHWRNNAHKLLLQNFRVRAMRNHLKVFAKRMDKEELLRRFLHWRGQGKLSKIPIIVGTNTLKRLFIRKPFQSFKDKVQMMNLKIPSDMPLSSVLIRFNKNVAKSAALRNIGLRPYWKKYLRGVNQVQNDELKRETFNKLFYPNWRKSKRVLMRRAFNRWKDVLSEEEMLNLKRNLHTKLTLGIMEKNHLIALRKKFDHWKEVNNQYLKYLNNVGLGVVKTKHHCMRPFFKKVSTNNNDSNRFSNLKKIMVNRMRNNDRGNLQYCFNRWKNNSNKMRELALKHRILKLVVKNASGKDQENDKNNLHEKLLRWRIRAAPRDWLEGIVKIRKGRDGLNSMMRAKNAPNVLRKIADRARANKVKDSLYKFISQFDPQADIFLLKNRFKLWRSKVPDTERMKEKLRSLANKNILNNHDTLVKKPVDMLTSCMRAHVAMKNQKAKTITDYVRNIKNIYNRMQLVKRNLKLHEMFKNLNLRNATKARILFARWMKNARVINSHEKASKIQGFLRSRQGNLQAKRKQIADGAENLKKYIRLYSFHNIYDHGVKSRRFQLMSRLFRNYEDIGLQHFKKYFIRWRNNAHKLREIDAADKIKALMRGKAARNKANTLLRQKSLLNSVTIKLFGKHLDKKRLYFQKWVNDTRLEKCESSGKVIQRFIGAGLQNIKNVRAQLKVLSLTRRHYIKNLSDHMKKAAKVDCDRGLILYNTLKDIFIQRPFDKVKNASKWIGRMRQLKSVTPKIQQALRLYWLPFYMRKWKAKTWDYKVKRVTQLQNWFRVRLLIWKKRCELRKAHLAQKFIQKMTRDNDLKLRLALKHWNKIATFDSLNTQAVHVQKMWRGNTSRKNLDKITNQIKCRKLFRGLILRDLSDAMIRSSDYLQLIKRNIEKLSSGFDKRYATNNLIDLSNNNLRNKYLHLLTNKRCYNDNLRRLRLSFNKFRNYANKVDDSAIGIQTRYRQFRANQEKNRLFKLRENLLKLQGKYETTDKGKLETAFRRWLNKANFLKMNDKANVIQKYLRTRNQRWQNTKLQNFFTDRAPLVVKRRLNNAAKVKKLDDTLKNQAGKEFCRRLRNKDKYDRLRWIMISKFHNLDGQLGKLYIQKYFRDWRNRANALKNKLHSSAETVQRMFKGYLARKHLRSSQEKKARLLRMLVSLIDDYDTKKQVYFQIWKNETQADKLNNAAKVLQKFLGDVKNKSLRLKSRKRLSNTKVGLEAFDDLLNKKNANNAIDKIKSEANRKLMDKVVNDLDNKRIDHLRSGVQKIKDFGDDLYDRRLRSAKKIQNAWKNTMWRRHIWDLIRRTQRLRFILKMMGNKNLQILHSYFRKWKKNAMADKWHSSAKTIQEFIGDKVLNWRQAQKISALEKLRKMFRDHFVNKQFRPYMKDFVNTVKIERFNNHMGRYIFKRFRYNIFNYEKLNLMSKLFRIPEGIKQKLLRKWLNIWRNKADELKKHEAALMIQRNLRSFKERNRNCLISHKLEKAILKLACQHDNIKKYYMLLWKRTAEKMKLKESADKISEFVDNNFRRIQARKNYNKLALGLIIKNGMYELLDIRTRYRQFLALNKIFNPLNYRMKKDNFDDLKNRSRLNRVGKKMRIIFNNFGDRKNKLSLYYWFTKWRQQVGKLNLRDRELQNLVDVIDTRRKIIGADTVANVSQVKRLFDLIPQIRAKDAFKNIKWRAANVKKLDDWGNKLAEVDNDLQKKKASLLVDKIYKVYTYKILDKMFNGLNRFRHNVIKPTYGRDFLSRLHENQNAESKYNYAGRLQSKADSNTKALSFKSHVSNPKREALSMRDKDPVKRITPHLYSFLKCKLRNRLSNAFNKIRDNARGKTLCKNVESYVNQEVLPTKNDFIDRLAKNANYHRRTPELKDKLKNLLRKYWVHRVCEGLIPVSRMQKLMYMIRITFMMKMCAKNRSLRAAMRRWKFIAFVTKITRDKMALLYKNMHLNYLNAATELFGENIGIGKEFENFGNSIGMFTNEDLITHESEMKSHCKVVKRKYVFDHEKYDNEDKKDYSSINGDNADFYYDQEIGEGTLGRYKVDTNRSNRTGFYLDEEDHKKVNDRNKTLGKR